VFPTLKQQACKNAGFGGLEPENPEKMQLLPGLGAVNLGKSRGFDGLSLLNAPKLG
jgi:hypothetical protein